MVKSTARKMNLVVVVFGFFVSHLVFFSPLAQAFISTKSDYYGPDFQSLYQSSQLENEALLAKLFLVLKQGHIKTVGAADTLVATCATAPAANGSATVNLKNCEQHTSLGYDTARKYLFGQIYLDQDTDGTYSVKDVYCEKKFTDADFKGGQNIGPNIIPSNGAVLNVEHTWPQSRFTSRFDKGMQKSDLHHLYPTDSQINSTRGSLRFGYVDKDIDILKCPQSRVGSQLADHATVFEPPVNHRGNVARSIFYFATRYQMKMSAAEFRALKEWSKADPPDDFELRKNNTTENLQGNRNPFVDFPDLIDHIATF